MKLPRTQKQAEIGQRDQFRWAGIRLGVSQKNVRLGHLKLTPCFRIGGAEDNFVFDTFLRFFDRNSINNNSINNKRIRNLREHGSRKDCTENNFLDTFNHLWDRSRPTIVEMERLIPRRKQKITISREIEALVESLFLEEESV